MTKPIDHQKLHNITGQILAHEQAIAQLKGEVLKILGVAPAGEATEKKKRGRPAKEAAPGGMPDMPLARAAIARSIEAETREAAPGDGGMTGLAASAEAANHDPDRANPEDAEMPDFLDRSKQPRSSAEPSPGSGA